MTDPAVTRVSGTIRFQRVVLALGVAVGTTVLWQLMTGVGLYLVGPVAFVVIGYPYALWVLGSALWHAFDTIEVGPDGLKRRRAWFPWSQVTGVALEIKDLQNRLGMTIPRQTLIFSQGDRQLTYFESRWYGAETFKRLVSEVGRFTTIQETRTVVPPPK